MDTVTKSLAGRTDLQAVLNLAKAFGISPEQAQRTIEQVAPEMGRQLERLTLSRGGIADLVETMGRTQYEAFLDDPDVLKDAGAREDGTQVLAEIFGTKHKSRVVAQRAARETDLSQETIKGMLPSIAGMFMGQLAKETRGQIQKAATTSPVTAGKFGGSNDPFAGQTPLSFPGRPAGAGRSSGGGGGDPYRDFGDILRRQGGRVSKGGSLANVIRDAIGGALGFQSKGIVSWIIRMVVMRYGWSIAQFFLRRLLGGR